LRIAAVTMVYNEALILPYFLRHYEYLDEIHVLYETDSTDETLSILKQARNVVIENCHIRGGLDDIEKVGLMNEALRHIRADWVYVLDSDEFIFPYNESPHDFLKRQKNYNVVRAAMFPVFRHRTDKDLDPSLPPVPQRIHGNPDLFSPAQEPNRASAVLYIKPIVVRPSDRIWFLPGNHVTRGHVKISPEFYAGVHWEMADPSIAIDRRMKRKARISERNRAHGLGTQNWNVTEEWLKAECDRHLDDPIIDALRPVSKERLLPAFFSIEDRGVMASELKTRTLERSLAKIERIAPGKKLLDIGYSCGLFVEMALDHDFDAYAIDFSSVGISSAKPRVTGRVTYGDAGLQMPEIDEKYDVITAFNVIEYIRNPTQFLKEIWQILTPGGVVVLTMQDTRHRLHYFIGSRWPMLQPVQRPMSFSKREIKDLLAKARFCDIHIEGTKRVLSLDYLLSRVQKYNLTLLMLYGAIRRLFPSYLRKKTFAINIGEFVVFAKKLE
jgi:2-polyprenyl-3-methyl-5-hydroxy-6-metoxy-1,4-benzoquinol methylase